MRPGIARALNRAAFSERGIRDTERRAPKKLRSHRKALRNTDSATSRAPRDRRPTTVRLITSSRCVASPVKNAMAGGLKVDSGWDDREIHGKIRDIGKPRSGDSSVRSSSASINQWTEIACNAINKHFVIDISVLSDIYMLL